MVYRKNLQTSGAIKIAKALQKYSTLTKLNINHNNITDDAADDIVIALRCNGYLQVVDISKNGFNKESTMKISFANHLTILLHSSAITNNIDSRQ